MMFFGTYSVGLACENICRARHEAKRSCPNKLAFVDVVACSCVYTFLSDITTWHWIATVSTQGIRFDRIIVVFFSTLSPSLR
jgi:hypothetical protein